jgi:cytochrome c peroxidase
VLVISKYYLHEYEDIFGPLPPDLLKHELPAIARPSPDDPAALKAWILIPGDKRYLLNLIYANMGKAIEAFVRTIVPLPSRFDRYVEAVLEGNLKAAQEVFTNDEAKGLRLFIGKAKCTNCHNGPLFTNGQFHNIGVPQTAHLPPDNGRADGILKVLSDEFNCLGVYSDAKPGNCAELRFININTEKYTGAFKVPTLRNVAERAPYMHAGQFATLSDVMKFYQQLKPEERKPELEHGSLSLAELSQLEAFLHTLSGPLKSAD